jgi:hypothetical protein
VKAQDATLCIGPIWKHEEEKINYCLLYYFFTSTQLKIQLKQEIPVRGDKRSSDEPQESQVSQRRLGGPWPNCLHTLPTGGWKQER